jgi:four helix bundle protein
MTFEDLQAWQKAREVRRAVYALCREQSIAKDFGLCSQIQRAAVSTMSNIAEGFERKHLAEKQQLYNVAHASNGEVRSLVYVIEDNYPAQARAASQLRALAMEAGAILAGLMRSTSSRAPNR